jgi:hypothetical protein
VLCRDFYIMVAILAERITALVQKSVNNDG